MNTKIIRTLVKKEMLDVFRDKKTVIMMMVDRKSTRLNSSHT